MLSELRTYLMRLTALAVGLGVYFVVAVICGFDSDYVFGNRAQLSSWAIASVAAFALLYAWVKYSELVHEFGTYLDLASHRRDRWMDDLRRLGHLRIQRLIDRAGLLPRDEYGANAFGIRFLWRTAQVTSAAGFTLLVLLPGVRLQVALSTIAALTLNRLLRRALADAAWMQEHGRFVLEAQKKNPYLGLTMTILS